MINILKNIARMDILKEKMLPKHLAIATRSLSLCEKQESRREMIAIEKIKKLIENQVKINIPVISLQLDTSTDKDIKFLDELLSYILDNPIIKDNKIRIMFIGKWFDFPVAITENMKKITEETKDYDKFFLNFLVKYDGKDEVISAIKLLTIKAVNKQIDAEEITPESIKESLFSSYFLPPDIIIQCGYKYSGVLLWDSPGAIIHFTNNKHWATFDLKELDSALTKYKKAVDEEKRISASKENQA
jgi:undecaprenyl diphosphate synthase